MIIRAVDRPAATLLTARTDAPPAVRGTFGKIEVLQLTSAELREGFGIEIAELDAITPFELAAALTSRGGRPTAARVRKDRLVRLIAGRPQLLPCFVGYQEVPGLGLLPFMSDGPEGRWSLFFEEDGRMTMVEAQGAGLAVMADSELVGPMEARPRPVSFARPFLFGRRREASSEGERSVIRIGVRGDQARR